MTEKYYKTNHCKRGHEYTVGNCLWSSGRRRCRTCAATYTAAAKARRKLKSLDTKLAVSSWGDNYRVKQPAFVPCQYREKMKPAERIPGANSKLANGEPPAHHGQPGHIQDRRCRVCRAEQDSKKESQ